MEALAKQEITERLNAAIDKLTKAPPVDEVDAARRATAEYHQRLAKTERKLIKREETIEEKLDKGTQPKLAECSGVIDDETQEKLEFIYQSLLLDKPGAQTELLRWLYLLVQKQYAHEMELREKLDGLILEFLKYTQNKPSLRG